MAEQKQQIGPCSEKQALVFKRAHEVDFMIIGGSRGGGKSEVITQLPLMFKDDPNFNAIFFRREYDQLLGAGGLWEIAGKYYPLFGAVPVKNPVPTYTFPNNAKVRFKHMHTEEDAEKHRGLQYSMIGFDEITQFSKEQVQFLLTCLRSEAEMNSFCIGTCNPDRQSWVYDLVKWYLDDEGFPDPKKNGKIRYYVVFENDFIFADTEEWFLENRPETVTAFDESKNEEIYIPPSKFCFIQLTIFDNPILIKKNPRYLSVLQNLPKHERDAQLYGNWHSEPDKVRYFDRKWVRGEKGEKVKDRLPDGCIKVCAWDKANTEYKPSIKNDPDFTACIHMAKDKDGNFYIYGDFAPEVYDQHEQVYGKFRKQSGDRDELMLKQARYDGPNVFVVIAQDSGADGKQVYQMLAKKFVKEGFKIRPSTMPIQTKKLNRFEPFATACQNGFVYILENTFDNRTLEAFYKELEIFDGTPSTRRKKDDWVDAVSDAFNFLNREQVIPPISIPTLTKSNEFNF